MFDWNKFRNSISVLENYQEDISDWNEGLEVKMHVYVGTDHPEKNYYV